MKKVFISSLSLMTLAIISFLTFYNAPYIDKKHTSDIPEHRKIDGTSIVDNVQSLKRDKKMVSAVTSTTKKLTDKEIVSVTTEFMHTLVQDITTDNKVVNFTNKQDLLEAFEPISSREVAEEYVDFYFYEKQDGLYINPTETPPWFQKHVDYETIEMDNGSVKVIQTNQTDLYGKYKIELEFAYHNSWKIIDVEYSSSMNQSETL